MYFEASLTPEKIIIEAETEEEFKEKIKKIPIENFIFQFIKINKDQLKNELEDRHVFLKL